MRKSLSPGQQQLPFAFDVRLNQIPEEWHQVAVRFRRANGIQDGDRERRFRQFVEGIRVEAGQQIVEALFALSCFSSGLIRRVVG